MNIQAIKQRFEIIGNSPLLDRAIEIACQVAPTDITVLITGESGVGKEVFPKIIHQLSARKHGPYIAINCGAIPEGTIDSELFGHEKGSFTDAHEARKGYFEVANNGTIFLDEVAELPLSTQVRLLRVLESGEFMKVGSSKVIKTNVRVVAATNVNILEAIQKGKFREDLYYRLNSVPITIPSLKDRKQDIDLLFRRFANDFAEKYRMPSLQLDDKARQYLMNYHWQGNVRQLKNITEQISIIERDRDITLETLEKYLPETSFRELPVLLDKSDATKGFSERELLYKVLFDMKQDIHDLKKIIADILQTTGINANINHKKNTFIEKYSPEFDAFIDEDKEFEIQHTFEEKSTQESTKNFIEVEEILSLQKKEMDLIKKAVEKYKGKRKKAAAELGISERTLYRKLKEFEINI
ncbi:MAG: sigma-54-dependent Fis family transcriptional regulator [Bacteroidetes bacterium]|nr:sigma-54-dependent Fis family transcriptional regulator [Bacteroidota bacterium]